MRKMMAFLSLVVISSTAAANPSPVLITGANAENLFQVLKVSGATSKLTNARTSSIELGNVSCRLDVGTADAETAYSCIVTITPAKPAVQMGDVELLPRGGRQME